MAELCPSCDAERAGGFIAHDDDCPELAASRQAQTECRAAVTGFCGCASHPPTP